VLQATIYLNEFFSGQRLKDVIFACWERKQFLEKRVAELEANGEGGSREHFTLKKELERNRVEVNFENFHFAEEGPIAVKMLYETRDDCRTREFEISIFEDPEDGLHYPMIDGQPVKLFTLESVYERFEILQHRYYDRNVQHVKDELLEAGIEEPGAESESREIRAYYDEVFRRVRALPVSFWPPAEYQFRYSEDKVKLLGAAGIISKTEFKKWTKKLKGWKHPGAWQCRYCSFLRKCMTVEYPDLVHLVADVMDLEDEEDAEEAA
jgi:hypothetical protein